MEFISMDKASKILKTRKDNIRIMMIQGHLKYKKLGERMVTTDRWIEEITPDNPALLRKNILEELNHDYFSHKKKA